VLEFTIGEVESGSGEGGGRGGGEGREKVGVVFLHVVDDVRSSLKR
jgi:hypothetical protein